MRKYDTEQYPDETLEQYYRRLAKVADQRLVRLEKLEASGQKGFDNVTKWAYAGAMKDIQHFDGENGRRFNTAPPVDDRKLLSKINAMKRFIEKPTSTKGSILSSYNSRAKSFNKKYGTDFSWQDIGRAYESKSMEKLKAQGFGSDTIAKAIAYLRNKKEVEEVEKQRGIRTEVPDMLTEEAINVIMNNEDINEDELIGW